MAKGKNVIGAWAFLIGVILALIIGLIGLSATWITVLLVLGILIGLLNVGGTELKDFMLAGTVLVIVGSLGGQALYNLTIANISIRAVFPALVALFVPATIVVALKAVFAMAKK